MQGYINVREEPANDKKTKKQLAHDFRTRRDLGNVDYSRTDKNIYSVDLKQLHKRIKLVNDTHDDIYMKQYGRKVQRDKTSSIRRGVVTFPREYQQHLEAGKFTTHDIIVMFEDFMQLYRAETGRGIFAYVLHQDEGTFHLHYYATNYNIKTGNSRNPKGQGSKLQDLGGAAFAPIGLERGRRKSETGAKHQSPREYQAKLQRHAEQVEEYLNTDGLTTAHVEELIKQAEKPLSTMLRYVLRGMNETATAESIQKNQRLAVEKISKSIPEANAENFNDVIEWITKNSNKIRTNDFKRTHAPKRS